MVRIEICLDHQISEAANNRSATDTTETMSVVRYPYLISKYSVSLTNGLHADGRIRSLGLELGYSPSISLNETRLGRLAIPSPNSVKNGSTSNTTTGSKANRALDRPEINLRGRIGEYGS